MSKTLNFTVTIKKEETGQWKSAIKRLENNEVDMGVAELTMTKERMDMVKFTIPIFLSYCHLFVKKPEGSTLNWSAYVKVNKTLKCVIFFFLLTINLQILLKVYTTNVWYTLNVMLVFSIILITIMKIMNKNDQSIFENIFQVWGMYCQQGLPPGNKKKNR